MTFSGAAKRARYKAGFGDRVKSVSSALGPDADDAPCERGKRD
jgi:hypothetical protein